MLEKKISLSTFPISSAILMRSVLETTIKVHFEDSATPVTGELNAIFNEVVKSLRIRESAQIDHQHHKIRKRSEAWLYPVVQPHHAQC